MRFSSVVRVGVPCAGRLRRLQQGAQLRGTIRAASIKSLARASRAGEVRPTENGALRQRLGDTSPQMTTPRWKGTHHGR